jgi:hypothetical protein
VDESAKKSRIMKLLGGNGYDAETVALLTAWHVASGPKS